MARKSLIQREKKKQRLERKYNFLRQSLKKEMSEVSSLDEKLEIYRKLQSPPHNSAPTRLRRCCLKIGRPRANDRDFELSRYIIREMARACLLAGVTKSSW